MCIDNRALYMMFNIICVRKVRQVMIVLFDLHDVNIFK